jgi:hypothetical protein
LRIPSWISQCPEQLDVIAALGGLAVGVGDAQDEHAGVQAVALQTLVEPRSESAIGDGYPSLGSLSSGDSAMENIVRQGLTNDEDIFSPPGHGRA